MYLEKRRQRFYACMTIPPSVRSHFGKRRFVQSLETDDKATAKLRAATLEAKWGRQIEAACAGTSDTSGAGFWRRALETAESDHERAFINVLVENEAQQRDPLFWRNTLAAAPDHEQPGVREQIAEVAEEMVDDAGMAAGVYDRDDPAYSALPAHQEAQRFRGLATGAIRRTDEHLEEYMAHCRVEPKTAFMRRRAIEHFCEQFPYTSDVTRKAVQGWINAQVQGGKAISTVRRSLSDVRGYWKYLRHLEVVDPDANPLDVTLPKPAKADRQNARKEFTPAEVSSLHAAALNRGDQPLADLIDLGRWTGARVGELCELRCDAVDLERGALRIEDSKTAAGVREVPVHSRLAPVLRRLLDESHDGYVLTGLTTTKLNGRGDGLSKRFGRLKVEMGHGSQLVFHSIRKTVSTLLEDAGVSENVAADILGHEKPRITYGLYSGGSGLDTRRAAIEKLTYPDA